MKVKFETVEAFEAKKNKGKKVYNGKKISSQKHFEREARKASGEIRHKAFKLEHDGEKKGGKNWKVYLPV